MVINYMHFNMQPKKVVEKERKGVRYKEGIFSLTDHKVRHIQLLEMFQDVASINEFVDAMMEDSTIPVVIDVETSNIKDMNRFFNAGFRGYKVGNYPYPKQEDQFVNFHPFNSLVMRYAKNELITRIGGCGFRAKYDSRNNILHLFDLDETISLTNKLSYDFTQEVAAELGIFSLFYIFGYHTDGELTMFDGEHFHFLTLDDERVDAEFKKDLYYNYIV